MPKPIAALCAALILVLAVAAVVAGPARSEEHTSELQSLS